MTSPDQNPTTQNASAVIELYAQRLSTEQHTVLVQSVIIAERDQKIAEQTAELDELRARLGDSDS